MEALGLDAKLLIAQIVNFAIFYFIFQKFVAKPLLEYIKKQKVEEKNQHELSAHLQNAKSIIESEKAEMVKKMNAKQKELINESKVYAQELKEDLLSKAKKQSEELLESGKEQLNQEKQKAKEELQSYIKTEAKNALMKSLGDNLDPKTSDEITKNIIKNI